MLDLWGFLWGYSRKAALASSNLLKILVSAAGFEPATHALKGRFAQPRHRVFNDLDNVYAIEKRPFDASCPQVAPKL